MLHVRNFLRAVQWTGEVPGLGQVAAQAAESAMGRAARVLIENIADILPSRGWEAGVRDFEKSKLSSRKYEPSSVRAALRTLKRAGLATTERTRDHRTGLEGYSTVHLSPALVGLARRWQALRLELKEATSDKKKTIHTELQIMQNVKLPFLYDHPGNPHEQGLVADPLLNLSTHRCSKRATPNTVFTPPQGGGDTVAPAELSVVTSPPPQGGGGVNSSGQDTKKENDRDGDGLVWQEGCEYSDVVGKNFEFWRGRRALFSVGRLERRRQTDTGTRPPWRPDGRPRLQEWHEDKQKALQDAPRPKILIEGDQSAFFEIRAFGATLDAFHRHEPGHTTLSIVRPGQKGRMPVFNDVTAGLWRNIDFQKVFHFAWAKSKVWFEEDGIGEQIFAAPGEKSRMILIDDLKTPAPVFDKTLCIVLETSRGNYQHLYCANRALFGDERHHIQKVLAAKFGGDPAATGGEQPHRIPGSTNYKKGRELFVCRLVGTVSSIDGGKPLSAGKWLHESPATDLQKNEQQTCKTPVRRQSNIIVSRVASGTGDTSASGHDWHKAIVKSAALRAAGFSSEDVRGKVESMLIDSAAQRGKAVDYYVGRTLSKLKEAGYL